MFTVYSRKIGTTEVPPSNPPPPPPPNTELSQQSRLTQRKLEKGNQISKDHYMYTHKISTFTLFARKSGTSVLSCFS